MKIVWVENVGCTTRALEKWGGKWAMEGKRGALGTKRALREYRAPSNETFCAWIFLQNYSQLIFHLMLFILVPLKVRAYVCVSELACICVGKCTCRRVFVWVLKIFDRHAHTGDSLPEKYPTIWPAVFWPPFGPNLNAVPMPVEFFR